MRWQKSGTSFTVTKRLEKSNGHFIPWIFDSARFSAMEQELRIFHILYPLDIFNVFRHGVEMNRFFEKINDSNSPSIGLLYSIELNLLSFLSWSSLWSFSMMTEIHCSSVSKICWFGSDPLKKDRRIKISASDFIVHNFVMNLPKSGSQVANSIFSHS